MSSHPGAAPPPLAALGSPLPPGWERLTDKWGRIYYANHTTGVTTWDRPAPASDTAHNNGANGNTGDTAEVEGVMPRDPPSLAPPSLHATNAQQDQEGAPHTARSDASASSAHTRASAGANTARVSPAASPTQTAAAAPLAGAAAGKDAPPSYDSAVVAPGPSSDAGAGPELYPYNPQSGNNNNAGRNGGGSSSLSGGGGMMVELDGTRGYVSATSIQVTAAYGGAGVGYAGPYPSLDATQSAMLAMANAQRNQGAVAAGQYGPAAEVTAAYAGNLAAAGNGRGLFNLAPMQVAVGRLGKCYGTTTAPSSNASESGSVSGVGGGSSSGAGFDMPAIRAAYKKGLEIKQQQQQLQLQQQHGSVVGANDNIDDVERGNGGAGVKLHYRTCKEAFLYACAANTCLCIAIPFQAAGAAVLIWALASYVHFQNSKTSSYDYFELFPLLIMLPIYLGISFIMLLCFSLAQVACVLPCCYSRPAQPGDVRMGVIGVGSAAAVTSAGMQRGTMSTVGDPSQVPAVASAPFTHDLGALPALPDAATDPAGRAAVERALAVSVPPVFRTSVGRNRNNCCRFDAVAASMALFGPLQYAPAGLLADLESFRGAPFKVGMQIRVGRWQSGGWMPRFLPSHSTAFPLKLDAVSEENPAGGALLSALATARAPAVTVRIARRWIVSERSAVELEAAAVAYKSRFGDLNETVEVAFQTTFEDTSRFIIVQTGSQSTGCGGCVASQPCLCLSTWFYCTPCYSCLWAWCLPTAYIESTKLYSVQSPPAAESVELINHAEFEASAAASGIPVGGNARRALGAAMGLFGWGAGADDY